MRFLVLLLAAWLPAAPGWATCSAQDGCGRALAPAGAAAAGSTAQAAFADASDIKTLRAARREAFAAGPLVVGPPWRAGEAVAVDEVRRVRSGHHLVYTMAGTTGRVEPVLGPAVLDGRPIADGQATAYLTGRVLRATRPGAPIVREAASPAAAGLTLTPFAAGDGLSPRLAAVHGCRSISIGTSFIGHYCFAHGPASGPGNATATASGLHGAGWPDRYAYHANSWEEEFIVTDRLFGIVVANSASPLNVEVDGVPVQAAPVRSSGQEGWTLVFDYRGVIKRRVVRVVSAAGSLAPALRGVALTPLGRVEPGVPSRDQVLILGDSMNATVTPPSEAGAQMLSYWLQRHLGVGGAYNLAVGGSGYVSQNAGTYNLPELLANPVNRSLIAGDARLIRHVIINAGFNDRHRPLADVQRAALASWKAVRQLLPNARISISDGWSGSSGPDAQALALAAALAATFDTWGDPNARLIRSVGPAASTAYVQGTGHAGLPPTAGNSSAYTSVDAVHPSPAGARHLARRLADDIRAAWGDGD